MGRRILNDALRTIVNAERRGKATANLKPISTVMTSFLKIMKDRGYIKDFQVFDPHRVGRITVELQGRINDCRALTYRQDLMAKDIEEYRLRMLPTRQWGYVVITTPNGVLDHEEAIKQNVGVPGKINRMIWDYFGRGCPWMKEVWVEKRKHESALRLVKALVAKDNSWQFSNAGGDPGKITTDWTGSKYHSQHDDEDIAERKTIDIPLLTATRKGIIEIVKEILDRFPQAAEYINDSGQNILHVASEYRRREIFDLVISMKLPMARLTRRIDNNGNTILHSAAWLLLKKDKEGKKVLLRQALPVGHPVQLEPGPALQLQAELRWFKHVKKVVPRHFLEHHNPLTPQELFTERHKDLLDQGKKWLKRTADSCSLVAVLFATVAFAAAYTLPGGTDQDTGLPVLLNDPVFLVFTVTDVMSLASSLTAVVMFLSILTSPFQEQDFRESLPWKLTLGFTFLFVSISTMMLTFAATIILTIHVNQKVVMLFLYSIAYLPVTIFALLQFPLYITLAGTVRLSINILKKLVPSIKKIKYYKTQ